MKSFYNNILSIESDFNFKFGDSIVINGVCLIVIESLKMYFSVELS